ncbi:MAG: methyltransferase domain-containing protein [Sphingomonadales bacterium]|jgi:16S rRNA (cytosine967-C5)-methyltransferase
MTLPRKPIRAGRPTTNRDDSGVGARRAAMRIVQGVLDRGAPFDASATAADDLPLAQDRGLARLLALTVLRWLPELDALIDSATPRPLPHDARARHVLRIALAGWLRLETPPHAVVATALPLVEGGPRRLVHGVLGSLIRRPASLPAAPRLPGPFDIQWARDWGADMAEAASAALAAEPATDLTLKDPAQTAHWAAALEGISLAPGHVRTARKGSITEWPGFGEGAWWVQDLAASLPARLLPTRAGERVLDLCAAPGGKTLQLAARGCAVTALDVSDHRLERVRDNLARTGLTAELIAADALRWQPDGLFDHILLDAPCSATGIFRRHPDVLHLKGSTDLQPVTLLQAALLRRAAQWLKPGGRLVYATCSLFPQEGERIAERVIAGLPREAITADELPAGLQPAADGWVRTLPGQVEGGIDGFFVARFRKLAD